MQGIGAVPAWDGDPIEKRNHHRVGEYARSRWEWLPRPFGGRVMVSGRKTSGKGVCLQVVPGPAGLYQIVRVDLKSPVARGFLTPEEAEAWVGRAVRAGVLPEGVTLLEGPTEGAGPWCSADRTSR